MDNDSNDVDDELVTARRSTLDNIVLYFECDTFVKLLYVLHSMI